MQAREYFLNIIILSFGIREIKKRKKKQREKESEVERARSILEIFLYVISLISICAELDGS